MVKAAAVTKRKTKVQRVYRELFIMELYFMLTASYNVKQQI